MNRRNFIKNAGCAAMGSTTLMSTLTNLTSLNGALGADLLKSAPPTDYKAMVCILLSGGVDSYNMLVPTGTNTGGDNGYNEYKTVRTDLALPNVGSAGGLLPLTNPQCFSFRGINCNYGSYGLHPSMTGVQSLFNSGKLAFMGNIGTLVEPIANYTQYQSGLKKLPVGMFSHSDQQQQWQTSVPQSRDATGFGGRIADMMNAINSHQEVSMNISLAGKNIFQRGQDVAEYAISNNVNPSNVGFDSIPTWWGNSGFLTKTRNDAIDSLVSKTYTNLLQKTFSTTTKGATASFDLFKGAMQKVPTINTSFANNNLSNDLLAITKIMSVRNLLGAKRQIFFINVDGWDMHSNLNYYLNINLSQVSAALKSFYDATVELGIADKVTTFTISDFARTITSNGGGADHAWGGNTMVMGGAVKGGKIYGTYPKMDVLSSSNTQNTSIRGTFIPSISTDEFYAELALWYGISPYDLCYALPNLSNFYSYAANSYPVGFMNFGGTIISTDNLPQNCLTY